MQFTNVAQIKNTTKRHRTHFERKVSTWHIYKPYGKATQAILKSKHTHPITTLTVWKKNKKHTVILLSWINPNSIDVLQNVAVVQSPDLNTCNLRFLGSEEQQSSKWILPNLCLKFTIVFTLIFLSRSCRAHNHICILWSWFPYQNS